MENEKLRLSAAQRPRETHAPEQMIPTGRKVYTTSQLKQKARETLLANYKKEEASNA